MKQKKVSKKGLKKEVALEIDDVECTCNGMLRSGFHSEMCALVLQKEARGEMKPKAETFDTGATRVPIPLHFHYICPMMLRGLAAICAEGFKSYPDKTVPYAELSTGRLGLPLANLLKHKGNHETKWLIGDRSEDHVSKIIWAWMSIYHQEHDCQHFELLLKPEDRKKV